MLKLSESDVVSVLDTLSTKSMNEAVAFVRVKYNCSEDEAIEAVDDVADLNSPAVALRAISNTPPTDVEDGDRFNEDFYGGSR